MEVNPQGIKHFKSQDKAYCNFRQRNSIVFLSQYGFAPAVGIAWLPKFLATESTLKKY